MAILYPDKKLQGDYGELIFEHTSIDNNYAYITLEEIYNTLTPKDTIMFKKGYDRILVKLPAEIVEEVKNICKPSNYQDNSPSFVFDYLTIFLKFTFEKTQYGYRQLRELNIKDFHWVEVKTGKSKLTRNQKKYIKMAKIQVGVFRIPVEMPSQIEVNWENKYSWIKKEQKTEHQEEPSNEESYSEEELKLIGFDDEQIQLMKLSDND